MLSKESETNLSKFVSYILRHNPEEIDIKLDINGWVYVEEFINKSQTKFKFTFEDLKQVVNNNNKKRFVFSDDYKKIKAQQGHSVKVDLDLPFVQPPKELYHGTTTRFIDSIKVEGLKPMNRHDVHLSFNKEIAKKVGERHGKVLVLIVDSDQMYKDGYGFQCTANNVWLTKSVPTKYLKNLKD